MNDSQILLQVNVEITRKIHCRAYGGMITPSSTTQVPLTYTNVIMYIRMICMKKRIIGLDEYVSAINTLYGSHFSYLRGLDLSLSGCVHNNKHETFTQCRVNDGPQSQTSRHH